MKLNFGKGAILSLNDSLLCPLNILVLLTSILYFTYWLLFIGITIKMTNTVCITLVNKNLKSEIDIATRDESRAGRCRTVRCPILSIQDRTKVMLFMLSCEQQDKSYYRTGWEKFVLSSSL